MMRRMTGLVFALALLAAGCGGDDAKFDFKLKSAELRNLRDKDLGLELKFDRTVRSIVKADGVSLAARVYPNDGGAPAELSVKGIEGLLLEDLLVVPGAGSTRPADFYKFDVTLARAGKTLATGAFVTEGGKVKAVDAKAFAAAVPPPAAAPPDAPTE